MKQEVSPDRIDFTARSLLEDLESCIDEVRKKKEAFLRKRGNGVFYVTIAEKMDFFVKDALRRKRFVFFDRPYPEDGTDVFRHDYHSNHTFFCWSIPHIALHEYIMKNTEAFDEYTGNVVKAWRAFDYGFFGFRKKKGSDELATAKKLNDISLESQKEFVW